jgi:hypothetical protein
MGCAHQDQVSDAIPVPDQVSKALRLFRRETRRRAGNSRVIFFGHDVALVTNDRPLRASIGWKLQPLAASRKGTSVAASAPQNFPRAVKNVRHGASLNAHSHSTACSVLHTWFREVRNIGQRSARQPCDCTDCSRCARLDGARTADRRSSRIRGWRLSLGGRGDGGTGSPCFQSRARRPHGQREQPLASPISRGVIRGVKHPLTEPEQAELRVAVFSYMKGNSALHRDCRKPPTTLHTREVAGSKPAVPIRIRPLPRPSSRAAAGPSGRR